MEVARGSGCEDSREKNMSVIVVALLMFSSHLIAGDYRSAIDELNFAKLSDTYGDGKVSSILEGHGVNLSAEEKSDGGGTYYSGSAGCRGSCE